MAEEPDDEQGRASDAPLLAVAARRAGSRLFATYATVSLVPVVVLGAVLAHGHRQEAHDRALDQGRAQAAVIEEMAIAPALDDGDDLDRGLRDAGLARLQRATDLAIFQGSVVQLKLRSFSGKVAFSDDGSTAGALSTEDPAFRTAATGGTAVAIVADPRGESGEVIRVLQPVVAQANGRSAGVLELYLPYAAIAESLQQQTQRTYQRIGGGLAGLYLVLALLSWSTTRRLRRHAAQREHDALTDSLTLLPNRELFRLRAEGAVEQTASGAVVLVDLDHFKEVNDTLGHHAGDVLLKVVAERLTATLRTDDTVARLGGDEFGLVLPGMTDAGAAVALLAAVRHQLAAEVVLDGVPLTIEASFGIALYPQHGRNVEQLLRHADAAMYRGKRDTGGIVVYTAGMAADTAPTLVVQSEIRRALERDELILHYQPKIDLGTGRVCGLEALVRWQHPERGLLMPQAFLPAVEQSGLIDPLTAWVLRRALLDRGEWTAMDMPWPVAVNVSARNLESASFADSVAELLAELGTPADQLMLEVTETALAVDAVGAARVLADLSSQGIGVSIDDFGTGYTCLWQLETLPVSEVKIDRAFVRDLGRGGGEHPVVRGIIALVHGLGCRVTAEGIETPEAAAWLAHAGCDQGQGYLFSRPVPWRQLGRPGDAHPLWPAPPPIGSHDLIRSLT